MRAVQYRKFGGPEVLQTVEVDPPTAGPGTVRIAVRAAGVNAADWKMREGFFAPGKVLGEPAGVGLEAAGTVDQVGEGAIGVQVGDEVFGFGRATAAEFAVLDVWVLRPHHMAVEEAAGTPVAAETALRMLDEAGVGEGDTVVISGAAGGVGTAAIQFARDRGAIVIGTAGADNQHYIEALGALPTTYGKGWVERVRELAVAEVDAALDVAGAGVIPQLIELTGDPQRVVSIADFSAAEHGARISTKQRDPGAALQQAADLFESGGLRMVVERVFPLEQIAAAQEESRAGHARGRTVVVVD